MSNIILSSDEIASFHKMTKGQQEQYVAEASLGLGDPSKLNLGNGLLDTASLYDTPHLEFVHYLSLIHI